MKSSNETAADAQVLAEYTDLMRQYGDMVSKLEAIDESTLSAADDAYYIEVMGRINTELAETGLSLL